MSPSCKVRASDDDDDDDGIVVGSGGEIVVWDVVSLDIDDDNDGNDQRRCSTW